jgi:predicted membrane-bound spermidine synthase
MGSATKQRKPERASASQASAASGSAAQAASRARIALWLTTAFVTGFVIMSLELAAFRLYAPYFGYSIYVWGSLIGVVMAALALGYAGGGRLADRSTGDLPLYLLILFGAIYQAIVVLTAGQILSTLAKSGELAGPALATLIIFTPTMAAFAAVGPFVVRLVARSGHVGTAAGRVSAIGTAGSIAGVLVTSFLVVPRIGTQSTLLGNCIASALLGAIGIEWKRPAVMLALLPLAILTLAPSSLWPASAPGQHLIWSDESPYNLVRVVGSGDALMLLLNDETGAQTIKSKSGPWTGSYYDDFALAPLLVPAHRALVLGMGGGGSIAATWAAAPDCAIDAVEIDQKVIDAAARFFDVHPQPHRLDIHLADARPWLGWHEGRYDIIHVDLYHGGPYVPFYLTTVEFFRSVRAHLADAGVLVINVFDAGQEEEILHSTAATLQEVFPSLMVLQPGRGTYLIFAFATQRDLNRVRSRLAGGAATEPLNTLARNASRAITTLQAPTDALVFTDDFAPIEAMTRRMLAQVPARE